VSTVDLAAPLAGFVLPLAEVPDQLFAAGLAGDGVAIDPTGEVLHAPCAGEVALLPAGRHALLLRAAGAEVLLHVGIDTVQLGGAGFEVLIADGARVVAGQPLMRFSLDRIARGARSAATPVLLSGPAGASIARRVTGRTLAVGEFLMQIALSPPASVVAVAESAAVRRAFTVPFEHGLHARPAALVVSALKGLDADVTFRVHGRQASARSAIALMSLGARGGDLVDVTVAGADLAAAFDALERLLATPAAAPAAAPPVASVAVGTVRGVTAAPGLAVGVAVQLSIREYEFAETGVGPDAERSALAAAIEAVSARLDARRRAAHGAQRDILDAHLELVADPELGRLAAGWIGQGKSAAYAFRQAARTLAAALAAVEDARLRERAADLRDLERQVVAAVLAEPPPGPAPLPEAAIVLADELMPSQLIGLDPARLAGFVTAGGGPTSHVAIIAAAMGIPALVAAGDGVLAIRPGAALVLDADAGELHVDPGSGARDAAVVRLAARAEAGRRELSCAREPAVTLDGVRVAVYCNVGDAAEAAAAVGQGAEGCGLLRTEFLFLDRREPPGEDEQVAAYAGVAAALGGRPLVIRTLDAGGDKPIAYLPLPREDNPALGLRGLRTSLARPDLFATQLRAILRAAAGAPCRILLPMVTELGEVQAVRAALATARAALGPGPVPPLGVMIETPASALLAEQLVGAVEFLSIGTNDLSQYTLAMDRTHPQLAGRLDALHPAVLRLIERAAAAANAQHRETAVCGGLGSDPVAVPVLVGLGVRELSAVPAMIPRIKALLRAVRIGECESLARATLAVASAAEARSLATDFLVQRGLASPGVAP
jgi:phosphoenolpyruvate-protein phosphotransferase